MKTYKEFTYNKCLNEQDIINDILSINEGIGGWWNKFIQYGKKGILTTSMIIAIAFSVQSQEQGKTSDVLKTGIEMTSDNQIKKDIHNFIIGVILDLSKDDIKNANFENAKISSEVIIHHMKERDGKKSDKLSEVAKKYENIIFKIGYNISNELIKKYIADGKAMKDYSYKQYQ